jgi:ferrous iron transport protein B
MSTSTIREATIHLHPTGALVALVGNPNCGKTALFNLLTGSTQKVANYAGVTVERKEGKLQLDDGRRLRVLDLPGVYSLYPRSPDEKVTYKVLSGNAVGEKRPDLAVCVVDATNLRRALRLVLAVQRTGLPCMVVLNMTDIAAKRGVQVNTAALSRELNCPVVSTVGVAADGDRALRDYLASDWQRSARQPVSTLTNDGDDFIHQNENPIEDHTRVSAILERLGLNTIVPDLQSERIDRIVLHPLIGPLLLATLLFFIFQAVFSWAKLPMDAINAGSSWLGAWLTSITPEGLLRSFVVEALVAGMGSVLVFLPQILILFFFILVLEESGYLPRAAYLLDRVMGSVGLSGRSFIPLLSSFACAIPGIMAARTIANPRDRLVTILIAPMMTCSARLPVYALLIAAFIPPTTLWAGIELQGLVLFTLYIAGIAGAMMVAWLLKTFTRQGRMARPLMMELPSYHWPTVRNVALGLWQRALIFLKRVGGIILTLAIVLWVLATFPSPPLGATGAAIEYSFAGMLGKALAVIFAPIGFNWQICIALVPGLAAREVAVSALGTVYAMSAAGGTGEIAQGLIPIIAHSWSIATALSLLAWYVFAPQCMATIAATKRETGGWTIPAIMLSYLFALAYIAAFITYRVALWAGLG